MDYTTAVLERVDNIHYCSTLTCSCSLYLQASVDMSVLDLDIPFCFGFVLALVFDLLGIVIVTAIATWEIILVVVPALVLIQYLQVLLFYLVHCFLMGNNSLSKWNLFLSDSDYMCAELLCCCCSGTVSN